jgi:HPt (histidine-containing phosphotransfer) domain-containing protein
MTCNERADENCDEPGAVDFTQFDAMVDGPDSPCVAIYRDFVSGAADSLSAIREAAGEGNRTEVESVAHQLKGASASFGLTDFSARMKEAEYAAKRGRGLEAIGAEAWLDEATLLLERTVARVRAERGIEV